MPTGYQNTPPIAPDGILRFARTYQINPFLAFTWFAIDQSLNVLELGSLEALAVLSCIIALLLIGPAILIQRADGDRWLLAIAKGTLISLIVSIPTSIGSVIPAVWGIASFAARRNTSAKTTIDTDAEQVK